MLIYIIENNKICSTFLGIRVFNKISIIIIIISFTSGHASTKIHSLMLVTIRLDSYILKDLFHFFTLIL